LVQLSGGQRSDVRTDFLSLEIQKIAFPKFTRFGDFLLLTEILLLGLSLNYKRFALVLDFLHNEILIFIRLDSRNRSLLVYLFFFPIGLFTKGTFWVEVSQRI
jgi:hypothetical protein